MQQPRKRHSTGSIQRSLPPQFAVVAMLLAGCLLSSGCIIDDWQHSSTVRKTYVQIMRKEPSVEDVKYWVDEMAHGLPSNQLAERMKESPQYVDMVITQSYQLILRRNPDPVGMTNYRTLMLAKQLNEEQLESSLRSSDEYRVRFGNGKAAPTVGTDIEKVPALFLQTFKRPAKPDEKRYWEQEFMATGQNLEALGLAMKEAAANKPADPAKAPTTGAPAASTKPAPAAPSSAPLAKPH